MCGKNSNLMAQDFEDIFADADWTPSEETCLIFLFVEYGRTKPLNDLRSMGCACTIVGLMLHAEFYKVFPVWKIRRKISKIRSKFRRFSQFLRTPGVRFNWATNVVTVDPSYILRIQEETILERHFRTNGFIWYEEVDFIFGEKNAASLPEEYVGNYLYPHREVV